VAKKRITQPASTRTRGPRPQAPDPKAPLTRKQLAVIAGIVVVLAVGAVLMIAMPRRPLETSTQPFPAPSPSESRAIAAGEFVGTDRCAGCHREIADAWRSSTHARAGGPPDQVDVIAPFDGTPIRFADAEVIPRSSGGRFTFTVRQNGADDRVFNVDGVVGGGHMQGGGTQGFLSRFADGTWRFLPFDFSRQKATWFCNTIARSNQGWVAVTPALALTSCVDWPPTRVIGEEPRFSNCQSCHGSQIRLALDTAARGYRTGIQSLGINCESCHGPGGAHVARVREPAAAMTADLGMPVLGTLAKDQSLGTCWQCHALKDQLRVGYSAGLSLGEYYSIRLPQLGDEALFPDGRTRTFAYQEGHLYSDCYRNGGMTCTSCHDPHTQRYRDVTGAPLPGRFDDHQCTSCHASKADSVSRHTKHAEGSPGSRCTSCHMPYLQQPELGTAIPYARSDHSIAIPRPSADSSMGIVGACKGCHTDRSAAALDQTVRDLYGELKPLPDAVQALNRARDGLPRGAAARLLLNADERHTQALFAGIAWFLEHHLTSDMQELERDVLARLRRLARHEDDDVAAIALASLHFARGTEVRTRQFLIASLDSLGAREAGIRSRWGVILGFLADRARSTGNAANAVELYRRAREVDPGNARIPLNHGIALNESGNPSAAVDAYNASLAMDGAQPLTLVNLGIALAARNDIPGALNAYRRAIALNPREPLAYFNLAAIYAGQAAADSAVVNFLRAAELDPSLAVANFYASRLLLDMGNTREALRQIEAGLRFDPSATEVVQMRDELRRRLGRQPD
jgi:tetratricopeptide (TPR) repeat protein